MCLTPYNLREAERRHGCGSLDFPPCASYNRPVGLTVCKPLCFSICIPKRHGTRNEGSVSCLNRPLAMSNFHCTVLWLMYE